MRQVSEILQIIKRDLRPMAPEKPVPVGKFKDITAKVQILEQRTNGALRDANSAWLYIGVKP